MKKIIALVILILGCSPTKATPIDSISSFTFQKMALLDECDVCGCAASGGSLGNNSILTTNFVGLRYFNQTYTSRDGIFENSPWIDENFNTIQAWARIPIGKKIQITALIPYNKHERNLTSGTQNLTGFGDITLIGLYNIYQTSKANSYILHRLSTGVGVKIPTGKFTERNNFGTINQGYQLGTGSWDYSLISEYTVSRKKIGVNSTINYILKTENSKNYRYGNQLNYSSVLFYRFGLKEIQFVPQAGVVGEVYQTNKQFGLEVPNTQGDILFNKFGFEAAINKISFGINAMLPINQNLSSGKMEAKNRWSISLIYSI